MYFPTHRDGWKITSGWLWLVNTWPKKVIFEKKKNQIWNRFVHNSTQMRWITDNWDCFRRYLGKYDIKWVINTSISWPFLAHISIYHPIWQRIPKSKLHIITMGNLESLVVLLACIYAFWWFNTIEWGRRSWCYYKIFYFRTSRQTSKKYEFTLIGQNLTKKQL